MSSCTTDSTSWSFDGLRFINGQSSSVEFLPVKRGDRILGTTVFFNYNKPKAFGATRNPISDDTDRFHAPARLKRSRDIANHDR